MSIHGKIINMSLSELSDFADDHFATYNLVWYSDLSDNYAKWELIVKCQYLFDDIYEYTGQAFDRKYKNLRKHDLILFYMKWYLRKRLNYLL